MFRNKRCHSGLKIPLRKWPLLLRTCNFIAVFLLQKHSNKGLIFCTKHSFFVPEGFPTGHFTFTKLRNPRIDDFYVVEKRLIPDLEALKMFQCFIQTDPQLDHTIMQQEKAVINFLRYTKVLQLVSIGKRVAPTFLEFSQRLGFSFCVGRISKLMQLFLQLLEQYIRPWHCVVPRDVMGYEDQ